MERVQPGDYIEIVETSDPAKVHHTARVLAVAYTDEGINGLYDYWLQFHHDRLCESKSYLIQQLYAAYPDGWGPELTAVFFVVQ